MSGTYTYNTPAPGGQPHIVVTTHRARLDKQGFGMLWTGKARLGDREIAAIGPNPICDQLRAFLMANPEIVDLPWRVILPSGGTTTGPSARLMAGLAPYGRVLA